MYKVENQGMLILSQSEKKVPLQFSFQLHGKELFLFLRKIVTIVVVIVKIRLPNRKFRIFYMHVIIETRLKHTQ